MNAAAPCPRFHTEPLGSTPGRRLGSTIGAVFGVAYIEVNAGSLPAIVMLALRALGAAAFVVVVVRLWRQDPRPTRARRGREASFSGRYWLIVALEAAGIVAGHAVLRAAGLESATVAWVSIVVGIHFVALAATWRLSLFRFLGTAMALCGAVALVAAAAGAGHGWVAGIGGVLPGGLLLWAATRGASTITGRATSWRMG